MKNLFSLCSMIYDGFSEEYSKEYEVMEVVSQRYLKGQEISRPDMARYYLAKARCNIMPSISRKNDQRDFIKGINAFSFLQTNFEDILTRD
jgi:hypothetical protein